MQDCINRIKLIALTIAIAVGGLLQAKQAHAAELQTAIVAGGCFWCVESDFERVSGVIDVVSGFSGGDTEKPSYKAVSSGKTGHYEVVQITYDADVLSYDQLLHMFFRSIDPLDDGGQFCDRGATYRTAIFVSNPAEKAAAEAARSRAQAALGATVVTPILDRAPFYPASDYHQDYYKSTDKILTRFGYRTKREAYKLYRKACGRDDRVRALWGDAAPFAGS